MTIDASVWLAARFDHEPDHPASAACIVDALTGAEPIVLPWLALAECVAATARKTGDDVLALETGHQLRALDSVRWITLDEEMVQASAAIAAACRLRAADAVYAAVAERFSATLVTLDRELAERCSGRVRCVGPEGWARR